MHKNRNDLFVVIMVSLIWIVQPLSYEEMRSQHHNYSQEIVISNSTKQKNQSEDLSKILLDHNSTNLNEIVLAKNDGILPSSDAFPIPFPSRNRRTPPNGTGPFNANPGSGSNSNPSSSSGTGNFKSDPHPRFPHQLSANSDSSSENEKRKKKKKKTKIQLVNNV